jgi:hypothetical protein
MRTINIFLGFGLFNCYQTFLVYLSIASDLKVPTIIKILSHRGLDIFSEEFSQLNRIFPLFLGFGNDNNPIWSNIDFKEPQSYNVDLSKDQSLDNIVKNFAIDHPSNLNKYLISVSFKPSLYLNPKFKSFGLNEFEALVYCYIYQDETGQVSILY